MIEFIILQIRLWRARREWRRLIAERREIDARAAWLEEIKRQWDHSRANKAKKVERRQ